MSARVLGDQRPQDRWAIVERHEAMANHQFVERLMKSLGVFVAAPAGGADATGRNGRLGVDDPFICGGTAHASRAVEDRQAVDLDLGASDGGEGNEAFIETSDLQCALKNAGNLADSPAYDGAGVVHEGVMRRGNTGLNTAHSICPAFPRTLATGEPGSGRMPD